MIIIRVGYERTSTRKQKLARQTAILKKDGCRKIFSDQKTGANTNRKGLHDMLDFIHQDDVVEVVALDRLGRNKNDDLRILREIKRKGAVVDIANLGAMTPPTKRKNEDMNHFEQRQNTYSMINTILIQLLAYVAETERREIKERVQQGIDTARKNGHYVGGQVKFHLDDPNVRSAMNQYANKDKNGLSTVEIARLHKMSSSEFYRLHKQWVEKHGKSYQLEFNTKTK